MSGVSGLMPRLAGRPVRSVTVAATSSTLLLCRGDGKPLTPGLMYDDRRAAGQVPGIAEVAPPGTAVISASSSLAKLLYLLEGMARIEMTGYQRLSAWGVPYPTLVRSIGGGARNEAWRRIRQTRVGVPVVNAKHSEAVYGAAMLGLQGSIGLGARPAANWRPPDGV